MTARLLQVAAASFVVLYIAAPSSSPQEECIPVIGQPTPAPFCRTVTAPSPSPVPTQLPDDGVNGPEQGGFAKPDESNTGVPDGVALTPLTPQNIPYPGDVIEGDTLTINTPGAVYEGFEIPYLVRNRAHGTIIRNSLVSGADKTTPDKALVQNEGVQDDGTVPLLVVQSSTLIPRNANSQVDGARGSNIALHRVEISKVNDGIHVFGTTDRNDPNAGHIAINGSWIHDLTTFPDPDQPDGVSHNDGIQVVGGARILMLGNRIDGEIQNAAAMIKPDRSAIADLMIVGNWLAGGGCVINVAPRDGNSPAPFQMYSLNEFERDSMRVEDCAIVVPDSEEGTTLVRGNRWSDGSLPTPNFIPAGAPVGLYWTGDSWVFDPDRAMQEGTWDQARAEALQEAGQFIGVDLQELGQRFATVAPPGSGPS